MEELKKKVSTLAEAMKYTAETNLNILKTIIIILIIQIIILTLLLIELNII